MTATMWPSIRLAFGWVHQAAHILGAEGIDPTTAKRRLSGLLGAMACHRDGVAGLGFAVDHFLKVTRSYWPGLFHCYAVADLPRTNNALEQRFGSYRHHERRVTERKVASPALVLRGAARILAATATRQQPERLREVRHADRQAWQQLRAELEECRQRRTDRRRFRRDPENYLRQLEDQLTQSSLPA